MHTVRTGEKRQQRPGGQTSHITAKEDVAATATAAARRRPPAGAAAGLLPSPAAEVASDTNEKQKANSPIHFGFRMRATD